jgi:hypothetical protein
VPGAIPDRVGQRRAGDRPPGASISAPAPISATATSTSSLLAAQCSGVSPAVPAPSVAAALGSTPALISSLTTSGPATNLARASPECSARSLPIVSRSPPRTARSNAAATRSSPGIIMRAGSPPMAEIIPYPAGPYPAQHQHTQSPGMASHHVNRDKITPSCPVRHQPAHPVSCDTHTGGHASCRHNRPRVRCGMVVTTRVRPGWPQTHVGTSPSPENRDRQHGRSRSITIPRQPTHPVPPIWRTAGSISLTVFPAGWLVGLGGPGTGRRRVMAKAFRAGFHRMAHLVRPIPAL